MVLNLKSWSQRMKALEQTQHWKDFPSSRLLSSQVSDGAAMVLLARRSEAKKLGLPIVGRFRSYAVVGVDPLVMGIGPAYAIPAALDKASLKLDDIDIFEVDDAFASQAVMTVNH